MIDEESSGGGTPAWVVTFADLMSLLMCFFVLLLSFSEVDKNKFKQIAGELSQAFGVQREVPVVEVPMGTSAVFSQFSPGRPEPTVLETVQQHTTTRAPNLDTNRSKSSAEALADVQAANLTKATAAALQDALKPAIGEGRLTIESGPTRIVLRVEENGSFASGSADVTPAFEELLSAMVAVLVRVPGTLTIEGHTDDVPIKTSRFTSNWDLSAARAAAVANTMIRLGDMSPQRLRVQGFAETQPREPNDSAEHRARNRRVEVIVDQSGDIDDIEVELERLRARSSLGASAKVTRR